MNATTTETTGPRAWVGCLACYNAGRLVGEWVEGTEAGEYEPCHRADHEESWVMDHEGYDGLLEGECSPMEAQRLAELWLELGDEVAEYAVYRAYVGAEYATVEGFQEAWQGEWDSLGDYAMQLYEDTTDVQPEGWPYDCIDWERAGRELVMGGDVFTVDNGGTVLVFRNL
jgi:antirestriction protein